MALSKDELKHIFAMWIRQETVRRAVYIFFLCMVVFSGSGYPMLTLFGNIIHYAHVTALDSGWMTYFYFLSILSILINCLVFDLYDRMGARALMERQNMAYGQEISLNRHGTAEKYAGTVSVSHEGGILRVSVMLVPKEILHGET